MTKEIADCLNHRVHGEHRKRIDLCDLCALCGEIWSLAEAK